MATRTQSRSSKRNSSRSRPSPGTGAKTRSEAPSSTNQSAFSWGDNAGPLIGAALAGVVIGVAANFGRKAIMQGLEATAG